MPAFFDCLTFSAYMNAVGFEASIFVSPRAVYDNSFFVDLMQASQVRFMVDGERIAVSWQG